MLWSGQLLTAGQVVNCRVLNISAKGAQLRAQKPFECGLEVILSIDRYGEFAGKLVWQDGANLGIQKYFPNQALIDQICYEYMVFVDKGGMTWEVVHDVTEGYEHVRPPHWG